MPQESEAAANGNWSLPLTAFVARNGTTLDVYRLTSSESASLQLFNAGLSAQTSAVFLPHAYDEATLKRLVERNRAGKDRAYVLKLHREIVGYFFLWEFDHAVPLLGVGLADAWQGQRLGDCMLRFLIDEARMSGRDGIELTTGLMNNRAYHLYRRFGFEEMGEVDNVAGDGRVVRERRMFLALKPGAQPPERDFQPPGT
jgi:ribosomal protein S18 acetylase RimI-like enzyme